MVDAAEKDADAKDDESWDTRAIGKLEKDLDARRAEAVEQLKATAYFERQAHWLLSRFPDAKLVDVPGLVKLVDRDGNRRRRLEPHARPLRRRRPGGSG